MALILLRDYKHGMDIIKVILHQRLKVKNNVSLHKGLLKKVFLNLLTILEIKIKLLNIYILIQIYIHLRK